MKNKMSQGKAFLRKIKRRKKNKKKEKKRDLKRKTNMND